MYKALSRSLKIGGSSYSELCYVVKIGWGSVWRVLIDAWKSSCSPQSIWAGKKIESDYLTVDHVYFFNTTFLNNNLY
jgi:hypothetical protein